MAVGISRRCSFAAAGRGHFCVEGRVVRAQGGFMSGGRRTRIPIVECLKLFEISGLARMVGTQIDVSPNDELLMRLSGGRHAVTRMGERDHGESRDNQVAGVAVGKPSAIAVGPRGLRAVGALDNIEFPNQGVPKSEAILVNQCFQSASSIWRISRGAKDIFARQCRAHINRHEHQARA